MSDNSKKRKELMDFLGVKAGEEACSKIIETGYKENYIITKVCLNETIPAILIKPTKPNGKMIPLLYCHAAPKDYKIGKNELINSINELQQPTYARLLVEMNYCVICIDNLGFGERSERSFESYYKEYIFNGKNILGKFISDNLLALEYLLSLDDIDEKEMTVMGFSMGSTIAIYLAAIDTRIAYCFEMCGITDSDFLLKTRAYDMRSMYFFVYGMAESFSTSDICAMIAPRVHYSFAGNQDPRTPPEGLDNIDRKLKSVYQALGSPNNWMLHRYNAGHKETKNMRKQVKKYLQKGK